MPITQYLIFLKINPTKKILRVDSFAPVDRHKQQIVRLSYFELSVDTCYFLRGGLLLCAAETSLIP